MTRYAALYCRLSPRPDGSYEGVEDQERWGREYAAATWPAVPVVAFSDKGISAANDNHRPRYEDLRAAVRRGEVTHLWAVEQTRLERREVGWFELAAELDAAGIIELHTNRDGIVRVRDEVAGIKAVLAAGEVRKLKRRVNDRLDEIAAAGQPAGTQVFGYRHGVNEDGVRTLVIDEARAAIIREMAERILAGWSLTRIAVDLQRRGIAGTFGGAITSSTARRMVTNAAAGGFRLHRGQIIGRGNWKPVLDETTWHAVRDKLAAPRLVLRQDGTSYPVSGTMRSTARRYLLTGGIAVCDVCAAPLAATLKQSSSHGGEGSYYICHPQRGGRACVAIKADPFEEYVANQLFDELDKPEFLDAFAADDHLGRREDLTGKLRTVERKRREMATAWAGDDDLTAEEWRAARQALTGRETRLRTELAAIPAPRATVDVSMIRDAWPAMNLDERREIVRMFVAKVTVTTASGPRVFNGDARVRIAWRTG